MTKLPKAPDSSGIRNITILFAVVAVLYLAREILIPLAFAVTVSAILAPVVALLEKLRFRRVPAALLVIVVAMASVSGISWVIVNQLVDVAIELPQYRENINNKIEAFNASGKSALGRAAANVKALERQMGTTAGPRCPAGAQ